MDGKYPCKICPSVFNDIRAFKNHTFFFHYDAEVKETYGRSWYFLLGKTHFERIRKSFLEKMASNKWYVFMLYVINKKRVFYLRDVDLS